MKMIEKMIEKLTVMFEHRLFALDQK